MAPRLTLSERIAEGVGDLTQHASTFTSDFARKLQTPSGAASLAIAFPGLAPALFPLIAAAAPRSPRQPDRQRQPPPSGVSRTASVGRTATPPTRAPTPARPSPNSWTGGPAPAANPFVEAGLQVDTVARSTANRMTGNRSNNISAGLNAINLLDLDGHLQRYAANLAAEQRRDSYDRQHRSGAVAVGELAGDLGLLFGAISLLKTAAAPQVLTRWFPEHARLIRNANAGVSHGDPRGLTTMFGLAGGTAGIATQTLEDAVTGSRPDLRDYLSGGASGAVGGVVTRFRGAVEGGAIEGATRSALDSVLHGKLPNPTDIRNAALVGAVFGRLSDEAGKLHSAGLSSNSKGKLGENLSEFKARSRGEKIIGKQEPIPLQDNRRKFVADIVTDKGTLEAKFGPSASLTDNQILAISQGRLNNVERWVPGDVGRLTATVLAPIFDWEQDESEPPPLYEYDRSDPYEVGPNREVVPISIFPLDSWR